MGYFKWGLIGHSSRTVENRSSECDLDCVGLSEEVSFLFVCLFLTLIDWMFFNFPFSNVLLIELANNFSYKIVINIVMFVVTGFVCSHLPEGRTCKLHHVKISLVPTGLGRVHLLTIC